MIDKLYCSTCGELNNTDRKYCVKCHELLHNLNKLPLNNTIDSFDVLFSLEYEKTLKNKTLTIDDYETIIENIIETGKNRLILKKNMTTLERIEAIAKAYAPVIYKDIGNSYGEYAYNVICVDKKFDSAIQIATLLHELTHHLFTEILEQVLTYTWKVKKTSVIESFIQTTTSIPAILLISEYCASTTESNYLPEEYVSYSSFNSICEEINYDKNSLSTGLILGSSMSNDIHRILSSFIDENLEKAIKQEFIINHTKSIANPICIEKGKSVNSGIIRNVFMLRILTMSYVYFKDLKYIDLLERNKNLFEKSYEKGAI